MDTAKIKLQLQAKKEQLENQLSQFATKDPNVKDDWDTKYPRTPEGNLEEAADEVEEYSNKIHIEYSLETQLKNVHDALSRIKKGTYGLCETCGKAIAPKRLEIAPESAHCTNCTQ